MATDLEKLVVQLSADIKQYQRGMENAMGVTNKTARGIEQRWRQANKNLDSIGSNIARGLVVPLAGVTAALGVREILAYADAWTKAKNSLAVAGVTGATQAAVLDKLYQSAQANAAPIGALTELYGRAAQANDALGASQSDLIKFTDGVAVALKVGGASAESAQGALLQLGQALGSGTVHAEEFNSVNEGARPILQAVAAGLDKAGGSVSKLKNLVIDGKVSSKDFFQAFLTGLPTIQSMAANATQTIEQGFVKVNNAFTKYIGQTDEGLGASQRLVVGLNALADNFKETADIVVQLASIIAGALVGRAIGGMIASLGLSVTAVTRFVAALRAASTMASVATAIGGIAAAAGPIGLVVGSTAVAALALFSSGSEKASAGALIYADALKKVRAEAQNTAPAIAALPDVIKNKLGQAVEKGTDDAAASLKELIYQIDQYITSAKGGGIVSLIPDDIIAQIKKLRDGLSDGTVSADEARQALARLAESNPQFQNLANELDPLIEKLAEATKATKQLAAERKALDDYNQTGVAQQAAYEKSVAAGRAFIAEAERRAALSKDQLALETQIADVKKRAQADGVTLTDGQVKDLAQKELAAKDSRSSEGKAVKKTADDRIGNDVRSVQDRIAALDLERETIGQNVGEQQRRQLALQLEQQALADLREEARRNGETNLDAIALSPEQVAAIDEVSAAWGRAAQRMDEAQIAQQHFNEAQQDLGDFAINLAENWTSVNDALKDGLKLLQQWVLKAAIMGEGPLGGLFGSSATGSGAGGLIGSLFGVLNGGAGTVGATTGATFGFGDGGYTGPGGKKQPAGVVHKGEYVFDADSVRRAGGPGALEAIRRGLKGYDDGGFVGAPVGGMTIPKIGPRGGGNVTFAPSTTIDARGSQMTEAQFQSILDHNNRQLLKRVPGVVEKARGRQISGNRT